MNVADKKPTKSAANQKGAIVGEGPPPDMKGTSTDHGLAEPSSANIALGLTIQRSADTPIEVPKNLCHGWPIPSAM